MWSLEGRRDIPSTNAKELDICVIVNWYPPALSVSLDSGAVEGVGVPVCACGGGGGGQQKCDTCKHSHI